MLSGTVYITHGHIFKFSHLPIQPYHHLTLFIKMMFRVCLKHCLTEGCTYIVWIYEKRVLTHVPQPSIMSIESCTSPLTPLICAPNDSLNPNPSALDSYSTAPLNWITHKTYSRAFTKKIIHQRANSAGVPSGWPVQCRSALSILLHAETARSNVSPGSKTKECDERVCCARAFVLMKVEA